MQTQISFDFFSQGQFVKPLDCTQFLTRPQYFLVCWVHLFVITGTFLFLLNTGWMSTQILPSSYYTNQGPQKKTSRKVSLKSFIKFFASVVRFSSFWQNELFGMSHNLNFSIQSVPNKFSVFFNTNIFSFNVLPWKVTFSSDKFFLKLDFLPCHRPGHFIRS